MRRLHLSGVVGLSHFKAHVDPNHASLSCLWADVMVPIEMMVPLARLALSSKSSELHDHIHDIETLEEKKERCREEMVELPEQISQTYNK